MTRRMMQGSALNFAAAFILTFSLFALWGLGHRLYDTLLPQFAQAFGLQSFELGLTRSVYVIVYILAAIPAALYARRFGYKAAIIFGLGSVCVGAFLLYPAAGTGAFPYFLGAVSVMALGWIWLEVAANPLAAALGREETAIQRLNLAQSFYPVGALAGILCGQWLVASHLVHPAAHSAYSIAHPYIVIGAIVLLLAYLIEETQFPAIAVEGTAKAWNVGREFRALLSRPIFVFGVAAQFFGTVALTCLWAPNGRLFAVAYPGLAQTAMADILMWSTIAYAVGRFIGTALMSWIAPERLLAIFAGGGILAIALPACTGAPIGAVSLLTASFFLSIVWPTVLGIAIRGLGSLMKLGTALICMAGAAGAVASQMINVTWTSSSADMAMLVPIVSYAAVLAFAIVSFRAKPAAIPHAGRKLAIS